MRSCTDTDIDPKLFVRILLHFDDVAGFFQSRHHAKVVEC